MSGPWPDHPGELYRLVAPPESVAAHVVSQPAAAGDARSASGVLLLAAAFRVRLDADGAVLDLRGPGAGTAELRARGEWRSAVPEVVAAATARVRGDLPARYLDWFGARVAMPRDTASHDAPDVTTLEEVLALARERFADAMGEPEPVEGRGGDLVRVRLYDAFELETGLERPRGRFVRTLRLPQGVALGAFPGEPQWPGTTPGSVRRAYRVLDEYCRARLDLPPRADDEETP